MFLQSLDCQSPRYRTRTAFIEIQNFTEFTTVPLITSTVTVWTSGAGLPIGSG
jgi:hypothetical protein